MPSISNLVKKTDYHTKLLKLRRNVLVIIMTNIVLLQSFNTLAADVLNERLGQINLITKTDFDDKLLSLNRKITAIKSKIYLMKMN